MPMNETKPRVGGFKESAEYFEARARRARNETDLEHLMNAARFYRELASITPELPPHYEAPKRVSRAHRYRNRAEECRAIADRLVDENSKRQLADIATTYERLAAINDLDDRVVIRASDAMRRGAALLDQR